MALLSLAVARGLDGVIDPAYVPWWSLVVVFFAAELYALNVEGRVELAALSPHDAALVFGFFLVTPGGLLGAQLAGALLALALLRRSRPKLVALRLAALALATSLAIVVFHACHRVLAGGEHGDWVAAFAGASVASLAGVLSAGAVAAPRGTLDAGGLLRRALLALAGSISSTSIALVAVKLVQGGELAALLLIVPFAGGAILLRAYAWERRRLEHLRALYESIRMVGRAPGLEGGVAELLGATRSLLGADVARIFLLPSQRFASGRQAAVTPAGETRLVPAPLTPLQEAAVTAALRSRPGIVLSAGRGPESLRGFLGELRLREAILTALRGDDDVVVGVLLAGDRRGASFGDEDLRLFETFASHAGVLLQNDRLEESLAELRTLKEQLRHQAYHDALTGLPNRRLFAEHVARAMAEAPGRVGVLFLDLDDFKTINDSLGHSAGDALLEAVAGRVRACVRSHDVPARLGGDEFAVLVLSADARDAQAVAERLVQALEEPFTIEGREMSVHTSVGIAYGGTGAATADELLRNADVAMYDAKQAGKRRYAVYAPEMHRQVRRRQELVVALERAVERGEIGVHFQPIVDLGTSRLVALEALARWDRPDHGLQSPSSFIPIADELGIMVDIGSAVLRAACRQVRAWEAAFPHHRGLVVNVNLAPSELHDPELAHSVHDVLSDTGLAPHRLVLEITESGVMSNPARALRTMRDLRSLGVALALDDFGTGHSSLAYLREFPLDALKIARPFVAGLPDGHVDGVFVDAIVRLASSLGLEVVAEGIETSAQAAAVSRLGCTRGQGYYFGSPLSQLGVADYLGAETLPQAETRTALERVA